MLVYHIFYKIGGQKKNIQTPEYNQTNVQPLTRHQLLANTEVERLGRKGYVVVVVVVVRR
jgi:hypothetical protein